MLITQQPVQKAARRRRNPLLADNGRIRALTSRSDDAHSSSVASIDAPVTTTSSPWRPIDSKPDQERNCNASIGALPIGELNAPLVSAFLCEIESRGAIETAKRVRQRISGVFVFAIAKGLTQVDPAEKLGAVLKPLRKGRQPAITDLARLRAMIIAAEQDYARPPTRLALRLLALTAVRPSELRGACWNECEELNDDAPLWRIPAARMKGDLDRKDELGEDHLVPLTPQAIRVLKALWPLTGGGSLVSPSNRHAHRPMSENAIGYLLNRAGYRASRTAWVPGGPLDDHEQVGRAARQGS